MANLDISLGNRSEATGRFNFVRAANGDVSFDDTQAHAVLTSSIERRGSYADDITHGSLLFQLQNLTSRTPSQSEAMVLDALQFLERSGQILNVTVTSKGTSTSIGGGKLGIDVSWTIPGGRTGSVTF